MRHIDRANSGREIYKALKKATEQECSGFTLGKVHDMRGGGRVRAVFPRFGEERKVFLVTAKRWKVSFYDASDPAQVGKIGEIVRKVDPGFQREMDEQKIHLQKVDDACQWATRRSVQSDDSSPLVKPTATSSGVKNHTSAVPRGEKQPSWPRQELASNNPTTAARVGASRH